MSLLEITGFGAEAGITPRSKERDGDGVYCAPNNVLPWPWTNVVEDYQHVAVTEQGTCMDKLNFGVDLIYNRIWVTDEIDFGFVLEDTEEYVKVWNAYLSQGVVISAVVDPGDEGVQLQSISLPVVLGRNDEDLFLVTIFRDGPAEQSTVYTFTVGGEDYTVTILGKRIVTFVHAPNWGKKISLDVEHKTALAFSPRTLHEQRRAMYDSPLRKQSFTVEERGNAGMRLINQIKFAAGKLFGVPIYKEVFWTSGTIQGEIAITSAVDLSLFYHLQNFTDKVVIVDHDNHQGEIKTISSLDGNTITFDAAVAGDFDASTTLIYPIFLGAIVNNGFRRVTDDFISANLTFEEKGSG